MVDEAGISDARERELRFVLSRGSIGEIERDGSDHRDDEGSDKFSGKTQRSNIVVVQERQEDGRDHCQGQAHHVTFQVDWFAWLTVHVRRALSGDPSMLGCFCFPCKGRHADLYGPSIEILLILQSL